jgi:hypothetical protein
LGGESCPAVIILSYSHHPILQSSSYPTADILSDSHQHVLQSSSYPTVIILSDSHHHVLQSSSYPTTIILSYSHHALARANDLISDCPAEGSSAGDPRRSSSLDVLPRSDIWQSLRRGRYHRQPMGYGACADRRLPWRAPGDVVL